MKSTISKQNCGEMATSGVSALFLRGLSAPERRIHFKHVRTASTFIRPFPQ